LKIFNKIADAVFFKFGTLTFVGFDQDSNHIIVIYILHQGVFAQKFETVQNVRIGEPEQVHGYSLRKIDNAPGVKILHHQ